MSLNKYTIQKPFAISAGAGSGKTYTLSRRYINALLGFDYFREDYTAQKSYFEDLKPARVKQIVTITYTEAAALEMKGRIFELVSKIIDPNLSAGDGDYDSIQEANRHIGEEERAYVQETLTRAFQESSHAKISTIHAFCLDIIKANADVARMDTRLEIIKEDEKAKELSDIIFAVLNDENNRETVLDISKDISMFFIRDLIEKYVGSSKFRKDYDSFSKGSISEEAYKALIAELYPLPEVDGALEELKDDATRLEWFTVYKQRFDDFEALPWNKIDPDAKTPSLGVKKFPETTAVKEAMDKMVQYYSAVDREKEELFFTRIEQIKTLLHQIKAGYDSRLHALGKIDFDTIISRTLEIIPDVQTDFKYIMVDEFQDTNATQFEIVKTTAKRSQANLFVVGDSKQSIYSFQGAEIEVFNKAVHDTSLFDELADMSTNYRSDGVVLDTVNKIFEPLLKKDDHFKLISQNFEAEAQALNVSKPEKEKRGSFRYLITSQAYQEESDEMETIARFIEKIYRGDAEEYAHISELIDKKEKAIAVLFDGGEKMLQLRKKLKARGIPSKISKSDNFYHTKEVNDIFAVLKAIDILSRKPDAFSPEQKYYLAGAMRSNILRVDENRIREYLENNRVDTKLMEYVEVFQTMPLSQAVKHIYDESNVLGVYAHLDDVEQRSANLYKFLMLCKEYEEGNEQNLYGFLSLLENAIYFSDIKEEEAFYLSDNTRSIELCTIHATKGLAYPLVLLANADKGLYTQITSDALKHNNFEMNGERKEIVGFKIGDYVPLSHRVLKEIDKLKHLAEKKRLLYVALTRAQHDVVISAQLKAKKDGDISLREDAYLFMILDSLGIDVEELYEQNPRYCIAIEEEEVQTTEKEAVSYVEAILPPLAFASKKRISATGEKEESVSSEIDIAAANRGTAIHKIIELYWERFRENQEAILDKMGIHQKEERESIVQSMERFYASDLYASLKGNVPHHFELEFNLEGKTGFIDLIYYDKAKEGWVIVDFKTGSRSEAKEEYYQKQLEFYEETMEAQGYRIVDTRLLWL